MTSRDGALPGGDARLEVFVLPGIGEIRAGDDLAAIILAAAGRGVPASDARHGSDAGRLVLADGDILAVTSKIVSKAEGRQVAATDREQAITDETVRVVATRAHPGGVTRIVENRQGLVMAAAGVDASNVAEGTVLLLPVDPDASARALCASLRAATGLNLGVLITDTVGRPWRDGQTDIAIGAAGVAVLDDLRGTSDAHGRRLDVTMAAVADEIAGAADLIKGKTSGNPVAVLRGLGQLVGPIDAADRGARRLLRDSANDMFRVGSAEAYAEGYAAGLAAAGAASAAGAPGAAGAASETAAAGAEAASDTAAAAAAAAPAAAPATSVGPTDSGAEVAQGGSATSVGPTSSVASADPGADRGPANADGAGTTKAADDKSVSADLPEDAPSGLSDGHIAATREIHAAGLPESASWGLPDGYIAATRGTSAPDGGGPGGELPVEAASRHGNGPEVASREGAAPELPVEAASGHGNGPEVSSRGTTSA